MGANKSTDLDSQRIAEIATEVNGQFAKDFSIAFKDAIVQKIKSAYLPSDKNFALTQSDTPCENIKMGYLLKMGGNVKNWKKRYFVVKNRADNYTVIYYEDSSMLKEKGRFSCCGYQVESFSEEEETWYGCHGMKLQSYDSQQPKRQWLFRARNESEQSEWLEVFMNTCKKVRPEPLKDTVYHVAFKSAFRQTKAAYGYFGVCFVFGTEVEMLEHLTNQILAREILDEYIIECAKVQMAKNGNHNPHSSQNVATSGNSTSKALVLNVHQSVQRIVKPIVQSTWRECFNAADGLRPSYELTVKASLRMLLDKEKEIRDVVEPRIIELVNPFLHDFNQDICDPIMEACLSDITNAYEQALCGFHAELLSLINTTSPLTADKVRPALQELSMAVEQGSTGPLSRSQKILWRMHTEHLIDVQDIFELSAMAGYDVYSAVLDDLKLLLQNSINTFSKAAFPTAAEPVGTLRRSINPERAGIIAATAIQEAETGSVQRVRKSLVKHSETGIVTNFEIPPPPPVGSGHSIDKVSLVRLLDNVILRLGIDAKATFQSCVVSLLADAMEAKVQETMLAPVADIVLMAQSLVTREAQLLVNLQSIGEEIVRSLVRDFICSVTANSVAESSDRIDLQVEQLRSSCNLYYYLNDPSSNNNDSSINISTPLSSKISTVGAEADNTKANIDNSLPVEETNNEVQTAHSLLLASDSDQDSLDEVSKNTAAQPEQQP